MSGPCFLAKSRTPTPLQADSPFLAGPTLLVTIVITSVFSFSGSEGDSTVLHGGEHGSVASACTLNPFLHQGSAQHQPHHSPLASCPLSAYLCAPLPSCLSSFCDRRPLKTSIVPIDPLSYASTRHNKPSATAVLPSDSLNPFDQPIATRELLTFTTTASRLFSVALACPNHRGLQIKTF